MVVKSGVSRQGRGPLPIARRRAIPRSVLAACVLALAIPAVHTLAAAGGPSDLGLMVWLVALGPAFLLGHYRGLRGVSLALLAGLAALLGTHATALAMGGPAPRVPALLAILSTYLSVGVAVAWLTAVMHRGRERAEARALLDELTGIPNRRHVRLVLDHDFAAARRGRPLVVVMFDLDNFKEYNDRHGHGAGDEALRRFARLLHSSTRRMNTCGRYGGEEFLAVLDDTELASGSVFAERLRREARDLELPHGTITVSVGVAEYHPSMASAEDLIAAADGALYRAKSEGGDTVRVAGTDRAFPLEAVAG
jgi:diguanylate cyclase (GGDEF)-like protein